MHKTIYFVFLLIGFTGSTINAQNLYFPPLTGNTWETTPPEELNWCIDSVQSMVNYVGTNNSKAFLILKEGKIVVEEYFGSFTADSFWYWASAGKSLTGFLVGMAQEEGLLSIDSASSIYQGNGWTSCTSEQEQAIKVRNQLTMTTGLETDIPDLDCTLPECLTYLAEPGTRWYYHNAPYTQLDNVIAGASGQTLNQYYITRVRNRLGMNGGFFENGYNNVNVSTARSFARFGLMILNRGIWANDTLMHDMNYFDAMLNSSQALNQAYGYLWWLNGKESFRLPESEIVFPGYLLPDAPADLIAAVGKNSQLLLIIPSQNLIVVRMGDEPPGINGLVPTALGNQIMKRIGNLECLPNQVTHAETDNFPQITTVLLNSGENYQPKEAVGLNGTLTTLTGMNVTINFTHSNWTQNIPKGYYWLRFETKSGNQIQQIVIH
jgi:CubicO group peptidase (beta-lactamase class C family)